MIDAPLTDVRATFRAAELTDRLAALTTRRRMSRILQSNTRSEFFQKGWLLHPAILAAERDTRKSELLLSPLPPPVSFRITIKSLLFDRETAVGKVAEAHVHLAKQVAQAMAEFEFAQRQEAASAGATVPTSPVELKAGLLCGFTRAFRRLAGYERQQVPRALRYLGRTRPEYLRPVEQLTQQVGDETIAVWSDFAEAVIESAQRSDDPVSAMLEFATLVRLQGVVAEESPAGDMDGDAVDDPSYVHALPDIPAASHAPR